MPPVWPDLAKFRQFDKKLQLFGKFLAIFYLFGKILSFICYIISLIFVIANGQKIEK